MKNINGLTTHLTDASNIMPSRARLNTAKRSLNPCRTSAVQSILHRMPALTNVRHERFVRFYMKSGVASKAYLKAGYEPKSRSSLDAAASKLTRHHKIIARQRELRRQMAARNRITVDTLLDDLASDRELARTLGQPSAAIAATQLSAKLVGLLVDRKESGQPGDFAGLQSASEVLALVKAELGDETAALLSAALERREASQDGSLSRDEQASAPDAVDTARDESSTLQ